jgi:hypothetical protein
VLHLPAVGPSTSWPSCGARDGPQGCQPPRLHIAWSPCSIFSLHACPALLKHEATSQLRPLSAILGRLAERTPTRGQGKSHALAAGASTRFANALLVFAFAVSRSRFAAVSPQKRSAPSAHPQLVDPKTRQDYPPPTRLWTQQVSRPTSWGPGLNCTPPWLRSCIFGLARAPRSSIILFAENCSFGDFSFS